MGLCIIGARDIEDYQKYKNAVLLDLRSPEEFRYFHIPGAVNVPQERLEQYMKEVSQRQIVIFYCQHGSLSFREGKHYAREGYQICTLTGGVVAYRRVFGV